MAAVSMRLQSSDGQEFPVAREVAEMSETIKNMLEDMEVATGMPIPLPNVTGKILAKVLEYAQHHLEASAAAAATAAAAAAPAEGEKEKENEKEEEEKGGGSAAWDAEFCRVDQATLFELILAANYLEMKPLLDLTCKTVANMIKGKTPEEIRKTFNIQNDFTPEEEAQVRKENEWCEEKANVEG